MDINEIFKNLGMMIHEQGDVIGKPKPYWLDFLRCEQTTCNLSLVTSQGKITASSSFWPFWNQKHSLQQNINLWLYLKQISFLALSGWNDQFHLFQKPQISSGLLLLSSWKAPCNIILAYFQDLWFSSYPNLIVITRTFWEMCTIYNCTCYLTYWIRGNGLPFAHSF